MNPRPRFLGESFLVPRIGRSPERIYFELAKGSVILPESR